MPLVLSSPSGFLRSFYQGTKNPTFSGGVSCLLLYLLGSRPFNQGSNPSEILHLLCRCSSGHRDVDGVGQEFVLVDVGRLVRPVLVPNIPEFPLVDALPRLVDVVVIRRDGLLHDSGRGLFGQERRGCDFGHLVPSG
jgi:hypothetical protein